MNQQPLSDIPNPQTRVNEFDLRLRRGSGSALRRTLLEAMADTYPPLRHRAAVAAADLDDPPLDAVLRALTVEDIDLAIDRGAHAGLEADQVPYPTPPVRQAACLALRRSDTEQTRDALLGAVDDEHADVRYQALVSLHELGAADDVLRDVAQRRLLDEDPEVAVVAAQIAAAYGFADLADGILANWREFDGSDRLQMGLALAELAGEHGAEVDEQFLAELVDELIEALEDEPTLAAASNALVQLGAEQAAEPLESVLSRWFAHPVLKVEAAAALHRLGNARGQAYLEKMLHSRRKDARGYALRLIGRLKIDAHFGELVRLAHTDDYHADTAVLALGEFGGPEARAVLDDLADQHPNPDIRQLAATTIRDIG